MAGDLKPPTPEEIAKMKAQESANITAEREEVFKINGKMIFVKELTYQERIDSGFNKKYMEMFGNAFAIAKKYSSDNPEDIEKYIEEAKNDLEQRTDNDMQFVLSALKSNNENLTIEDLKNTTPSEMKKLLDAILDVNGISNILKKVMPLN